MKANTNDITDLLKNKSFDALSDIEKKLVLNELGNKESYDTLRRELLELSLIEDTAPPETMRTSIMDAFDRFHKKEHRTFIFWRQDKSWFMQPITIALATAAVLLIIFMVLPVDKGNRATSQLAEQKQPKKVEEKSQAVLKDSTRETSENPVKPGDSLAKDQQNSFVQNQNANNKVLQKVKAESGVTANVEDLETREIKKAKAPVVMKMLQEAELAETTDSFETPKPEEEVSSDLSQDNTQSLKKSEIQYQEFSIERQQSRTKENMTADALPELDKSQASIFQIQIPLPDHYVSY